MSVVLLNCPRGHGILASNDTRSFRYHSCEQCSGYWIPGRVLAAALNPGSIEELQGAPPLSGQLHCPQCRTECQCITVDGCDLDRCLQCHGVWLDGGEVQRVKRLFRPESPIVLADDDRQKQDIGPQGGADPWLWLYLGN